MERDPAIHVRRSVLVSIFTDMGLGVEDVDQVMFCAAKHSIRNRIMVTTKVAAKKRLEKIIESDRGYVEMFNRILVAYRQSLNHKHLLVIRKGDRDYPVLAEVANISVEFSREFNIQPLESGILLFVQLGMKLMGRNYGLNKFKYYRMITAKRKRR